MGVGMMIISVVMRMAMVAGLILIGKFILELSADALIISLVLGICGLYTYRFDNKHNTLNNINLIK
jgi:hypothetical protein